MRLINFVISFFIGVAGFAQPVTFNKSYVVPDSSLASIVYNVKFQDSSYFFIGGTIINYPSVLTFNTDIYGNILNAKVYEYNGSSCLMSPESVYKNNLAFKIQASTKKIELYKMSGIDTLSSKTIYEDTSDISVTNITGNNSSLYFIGWIDTLLSTYYLLIKTDSLGNIKFKRIYGCNVGSVPYQIIYTKDNNLVLSGESACFGNNSPYDNGQWYVVKVDTAGNLIWQKTYGNPNLRDYAPKGLIETADTCYILTGSYTVGMSGSAELLRGRILKIDPNGNIIWSRLYGVATPYTYTGLIKEKNNGNLICVFNSGASYFSITNPFITELTPEGDILWFRRYYFNRDSTVDASVLNSFDFTGDGGYIFAGYGTDYDSVPAQRSWVIKTDSLGFDGITDFSADTTFRIELVSDSCYGDTVRVVTRTYGITAPYTVAYEGYGVHDSLYYSPLYEPYISDTIWLTASQLSGSDTVMFIPCTVTDGLGRMLYDTLQVDVSCLVNDISTPTAGEYLAVHPNPADDVIMVEYVNTGGDKGMSIELYDMQGHKLKSRKVKDVLGIVTFDVSDLPNGTYIIKAGQFSRQIVIAH